MEFLLDRHVAQVHHQIAQDHQVPSVRNRENGRVHRSARNQEEVSLVTIKKMLEKCTEFNRNRMSQTIQIFVNLTEDEYVKMHPDYRAKYRVEFAFTFKDLM